MKLLLFLLPLFSLLGEEKPFVIVIPSYNNLKWCEKNIGSALEQDYTNFRILYIDDASNDGMSEKVKELAAKNPKITLIHNPVNQGVVANLYHTIHTLKKRDIVVILDGDDQLAHPHVLKRLNEEYQNSETWMTYGSYVSYPSYQRENYSSKPPKSVVQEGSYRDHQWRYSHLRSFYAALFQKIKLEDLLDQGKFWDSAGDLATMYPMLEMARDHAHYLKEVLYLYNRANTLSDSSPQKLRRQKEIKEKIRRLPKYAKLSHLSLEENSPPMTQIPKEDFDKLNGKGTNHWKHLAQARDLELFTKFRSLYEKNAPFLDEPSQEARIPKVVHFIWIGPKPFPPDSVENVRTWMAKHPDWHFKFWTDRGREPPCHGMERLIIMKDHFPHLWECYQKSENYGEKSDVLRFEILYQEGGVYVDHDANCLHSFEALHTNFDFYCGLEVPKPEVAGYCLTAGNGVIGSRGGHPVIKKVIELIAERWDRLSAKYPGTDGYSRTQIVMERTYIALTEALATLCLDQEGNRDIVLPAAYFFAKPSLAPLYSQHFFRGAWTGVNWTQVAFEKKTGRSLEKVEKRFNQFLSVVVGFLSFNLLLIGVAVFLNKKMRTL